MEIKKECYMTIKSFCAVKIMFLCMHIKHGELIGGLFY